MRVGTTRLVRAAAGALLALAAASVPAQDYHSVFHPQALKGPPAGKPNTVLVLGTPHLSGLPNDYGPGVIEPLLAPLLDRLAAWQPTAIATEDLSGLQCDAMRRYPYRYAETVKVYCTDPAAAARATGLDVPAANAEADRLLLAWPASPTPGQRRHLAAVLLAAGERHSALVQWLRLPVAERHIGDGLDAALAVSLVALQRRRNESGMIAATLAARLGLERLWSVDDHTADTPDDPDPAVGKAYEEAIAKAWDNPASAARRAEDMRLQAGLGRSGGMLALYRAINVPGAADRVYQSDFGAALTEGSPQGFGRHYVGYWETRNLRMAANVRDVLGRYPGTRMLALVGASHKGYYEAYLDQMHDVRLADAEDVLTP